MDVTGHGKAADPTHPSESREARGPAALSLLAAIAMAIMMVVLAAGPIDTNDFWFHLEAGEAYATQGLWPDGDPMLHTANEHAPVQHEWLFGVFVYALERTIGLHGLRAVHGLSALAISFGVFAFARRRLGSSALAGLLLCLFLAPAWWRLIQLRPDLFSIAATFLYAELLFFAPDDPEGWRRRVGAALLLSLVWVNTHSLFALGPALTIAAIGAAGIDAVLPGATDAHRAAALRRVLRLASALALVIAVTALNPRGFTQHFTFFTSSSETAIWAIQDEWQHFDLLRWRGFGLPLSPLATWLAHLALYSTAVASLHMSWRVAGCLWGDAARAHRMRPSSLELLTLALALAGLAATGVSIRFAWMLAFAWLHLFGMLRVLGSARLRSGCVGWPAAFAASAIAAAFPWAGSVLLRAEGLPNTVAAYLAEPYARDGFFTMGADFLEAAGLEGNLFNRYTIGGYLGHRLSPRIRTFVDGRAEHYDAEVLYDYFAINRQRPNERGESALQALDRYGVDIYYGTGYPIFDERPYTTPRVELEPGWIQVFRTHELSISLRRNARNRENLERVAAYYAARGVPFSEESGFDPTRALRSAPQWSFEMGLVPEGYREMRRRSLGGPGPARNRARNWLATLYFLLGAYDQQIAIDRGLTTLQPGNRIAAWRLVHGLLRAQRSSEALSQASALARRDASPRSQATLAIAEAVHKERAPADGPPISSIAYDASLYLQAELSAFYRQGREAAREVR